MGSEARPEWESGLAMEWFPVEAGLAAPMEQDSVPVAPELD